MAVNEVVVDASPEEVWAVLADWRRYADWVVGAKHIRGVDPGFPAVGTRFYPVVGVGPLSLPAETEVLEVEPGRRIVLHAKASPLGTAINELVLSEADGDPERTLVRFREDPGDRASAFLFTPLTHLVLRGRNEEALRRLKSLCE